MKILIAGNDFNAYLTACFIKVRTPENDIFLTRDEDRDDGIYTVEIKSSDIIALKDFVKNNGIDFTVVFSPKAIRCGIFELFTEENLSVYAPDSEAAGVFYNNAVAKKLMYKLKIPTPRFGIFDKENSALDYALNAKYPVFVKYDNTQYGENSVFCKNFSEAKTSIQKIFEEPGNKAVIENCADNEYYNVYFITDGYNAYPLTSTKNFVFKYSRYILSPAVKVSDALTLKLLQNVIYPLIDDIASFSSPYKGVIGLKVSLSGNDYKVAELFPGFKNYDLQAFLSVTDENIPNLLWQCSCAELAQIGDYVSVNDKYSFTGIFDKSDIDNGFFDDSDMFIVEYKDKYTVTALSASAGSAQKRLYFNTEEFLSENVKSEFEDNILNEELRI